MASAGHSAEGDTVIGETCGLGENVCEGQSPEDTEWVAEITPAREAPRLVFLHISTKNTSCTLPFRSAGNRRCCCLFGFAAALYRAALCLRLRERLSAIIAINSLFVGFPLMPLTV